MGVNAGNFSSKDALSPPDSRESMAQKDFTRSDMKNTRQCVRSAPPWQFSEMEEGV